MFSSFTGSFSFGKRTITPIVPSSTLVEDGLTLYLNANDSNSYSGSGSVWTDIDENSADNISLIGSPTFTYGKPKLLTFNGSSQYGIGSSANILSSTAYTKSVWFKINSYADNNIVSSAAGGHFIYMGSNSEVDKKLYCGHSNWPNYLAYPSTNTIDLDVWYNVTLTFSTSNGMALYINGILDSTYTANKSAKPGDGSVNIATFNGGNLLNGSISQVFCYNRELSDSEVLQNYNATKEPYEHTTKNLKLYYDPSNQLSYPGTGTTISDLSGNSISGTLSNISYTSPHFSYNGNNSQIAIADNAILEPGTGDWTMEAWFNTTAFKTGGSGIILGKFDPGGAAADSSYSIRTNNTGIVYGQFGDGLGNYVNSTNYQTALNTWAQVVYVWKNVATNNLETYINGISIGSVTHSLASILNSGTSLYIGSYNGGEYNQWFNGKIGIVRIYNRSLNNAEVLKNFNADKDIYEL